MSWEVVKDVRQYRHQPRVPAVEINHTGLIRINRVAADQFEDEVIKGRGHAILLYNADTKQIGVVPVDDDTAEELRSSTSKERVQVFRLRPTKRGVSIPAKPVFSRLSLNLPEEAISTAPELEEHPNYGKIIAFSVDELQQQEEVAGPAMLEVAATKEEDTQTVSTKTKTVAKKRQRA